MANTFFNLAGATLRLESTDPALLAPLRLLLGSLETDQARGKTTEWSVAHGRVPPLPQDQILFHGRLPGLDRDCTLAGSGEHLVLTLEEQVHIEFDRLRGRGAIVIAQGAERILAGDIGMSIVDAAIDMTGQTLVHGAALAVPHRDRAILVFAPSGTGKTTTALALSASGFALMSDDVGVLRRDGAGLEIWGLPRKPKVHRRTAALLPWLLPHLHGDWDNEGEQVIRPEDVPEIAMAAPAAALPLAGLIWLRPHREGATIMETADKPELLVALAADNLRRARSGTPDYQMDRFELFSSMVRNVPSFTLAVGDRLDGVAAVLSARLA
jgi:hypothetical protein